MASRISGATDTAPLSGREYQVAELIAWGAAKKEVPALLSKLYGGALISVHTVENITRSIYAKIHLNKANELSAWWFCRYCGVDSSLSPCSHCNVPSGSDDSPDNRSGHGIETATDKLRQGGTDTKKERLITDTVWNFQ